jgi:hypothetical protein
LNRSLGFLSIKRCHIRMIYFAPCSPLSQVLCCVCMFRSELQ